MIAVFIHFDKALELTVVLILINKLMKLQVNDTNLR
jgi:hypothetical protein